MEGTDCVIIGFNEIPLHDISLAQKPLGHISGSYSELKTNSVVIENRRLSYIDLFNHLTDQRIGKGESYSPFTMPNLGVAYLASFLQREGFKVEIVNYFNFGKNALADLLKLDPIAVAITTTYYVSNQPIQELVKFIRNFNDRIPIVVGGPRVFSICRELSSKEAELNLRAIGADIYIYDSQGEYTLSQAIRILKKGQTKGLKSVPNLRFFDNEGQYIQTERKVESNNLNDHAIGWHYFEKNFYSPVNYIRTSRGCPFSCAFCDYPEFAGPHSLLDLSVLEKELDYLSQKDVKYLIFTDDTLNVPLPRFKAMCRLLIRKKYGFKWVSFFRCSNADEATFDLMKESGCIGVYLGIESGDQGMLKKMNKFADTDKYAASVGMLDQRNIMTLASMIVGFPGETAQSVENSIRFLKENPFTFFSVQLYYHNQMAPVEKLRDAFGIKGSRYSWRHDTMDWKDAVRQKEEMIRCVDGPVYLPLYDFSIWAFPYFLGQGFSVEQLIGFLRGAKSLLLLSIDEQSTAKRSRHLSQMAAELRSDAERHRDYQRACP